VVVKLLSHLDCFIYCELPHSTEHGTYITHAHLWREWN